MREATIYEQFRKMREEIQIVAANKNRSDQEIITLRLQMNAIIRFMKWIFPLKWIFEKLMNSEWDRYRQRLVDQRKAFENMQKQAVQEAETIKNEKKIGRNKPCPCGSGKKYKRCCLNKKENKEEKIVKKVE